MFDSSLRYYRLNTSVLQRRLAAARGEIGACNALAHSLGPVREGLGAQAERCRCNVNRAGSRVFGSEKYMALHVLQRCAVWPYQLPVHGLLQGWSGCGADDRRSKTGTPCTRRLRDGDLLGLGNGTSPCTVMRPGAPHHSAAGSGGVAPGRQDLDVV